MSQSDPTQNPASFDPFDMWRQFYETNEAAWTKTIREVTTSQDYAEAQGKMLESMLALQKMMRDGMSAQLNAINLPTRDDVSRLGEIILGLEEKIDVLDDRLPALEKRLGAIEKKLDGLVERTKKDELADLEKKVDKLAGLEKKIDRLADLEKKVDAVDRRVASIAERVVRQVQKEVKPADAAAEQASSRAAGGRARAEGKTE